jgi:hypothetical protein
VEPEVQTGVLRRVAIEGFVLTRTMNLVSRAQQYFSPMGEKFREFARSYGGEHLAPVPAPAGPAGRKRARAGRGRRPAKRRTA